MTALRTALLLVLFSLPAGAATFYVADTGDNTTGTSWETAFHNITAAIVNSSTHDTIWIKAGTYSPTERIVASDRHFFGGFAGFESADEFHLRDWMRQKSTILGSLFETRDPVLTLGGESTIDGVIFGGHAKGEASIAIPPESHALIENLSSTPAHLGEMIRIEGASATLRKCHINNCLGGGRGLAAGLTCNLSDVLIEDCTFVGNTALYEFGGRGGGAAFYGSDATIRRSIFAENTALDGYCCGPFTSICHPSFGGALYIEGSSIEISQTTIEGNDHTYFGAGLYAKYSALNLIDTVIDKNQGRFLRSPFSHCPFNSGAGVYLDTCDSEFESCKISGNEATIAGAMGIQSGNSVFHSCLISDNSSESLANIVVSSTEAEVLFDSCTFANNINEDDGVTFSIEEGASVSFRNSIVRKASSEANLIEGAGVVLASYSNVEGDLPGEGNIDADPLFVNSANGDYRLQIGSPCIDSASTGGPSEDLDGNPRPVDIIGTGTDGPGAFDMGAYEFQIPRSDLNGDGYINRLDLMIFQGDWGRIPGN